MTQNDFEAVSAIIRRTPHASYAEIARLAGWFLADGQPNKMKAHRIRYYLKHRVRTPEHARKFKPRVPLWKRYGIASASETTLRTAAR